MAFAGTVLSAAVSRDDTTVLLQSLTGVQAGMPMRIEGEVLRVVSVPGAATTPVPVLRGQEGTAQVAHPLGASVIVGLGPSGTAVADWGQSVAGAAQIVSPVSAVRNRIVRSYSVAGAIELPAPGSDMVAILNGTGALAMTLANPSVGQDGDRLTIIANGKAAHTVTYAAGLGNGGASFDTGTWSATLQMCAELIACGGFWVLVGPSSATAMAGSPTWA